MFHPEGPTFIELARQALSSTERGYDLLAPKFDLTPFRTPGSLLAAAAPYLAEPGGLSRAVDLCCGTGAAVEMLRPLCRDRVVGVDFSRGMLAEAGRQLATNEGAADAGGAEVELVRADVVELDFDAEFDLAVCFSALGHVLRCDQSRLVAGVVRALAPGGRFAFESADLPPPWSPRLWFSLAFNAAMAVRNAIWRPPFRMYYMRLLVPRARRLLEEHGLEVEVHRSFYPELPWCHLVVGRRPGRTDPTARRKTRPRSP